VRAASSAALRVGFVGRYDETKGLHVLVQAMRTLPADAGIELHVWGVARTPDARDYRARIERLANGVPAIVLHDEARAEDIYPHIDVLCVPSVYFETGPLVVLEAHAWGVPVVGTNIGGIPERVEEGINGCLVPPNDPDALASTILELRDPARLRALQPRHAVRTMADAASDTLRTYEHLLSAVPA
jgi:glycosyltransferase involved in cell wall biosynthesis